MPTNEKNNWDRANAQGENQTDFNRHKSDREYDRSRQEAADESRNNAVDSPGNAQDGFDGDERANPSAPDFLMFGTSDEDMQF